MAKNKITIDIEVNGKMQKATVSAKKLRDTLDGVEKAQQRTNKSQNNYAKGLKGVGQQSANASKNFAKFSGGMDGLVGVYASLAAQLFAVSAAFQFLKGAGNLESLKAGQQAYAAGTGVALRTLTNDIINATNAQVTFSDAAQAAAIGTAAGLSADQLTRLGKSAADAGQILGRDVTDSFNRLVRGVTKAEPELLDELGIILRLDDASDAYAQQLGITAEKLTQAQKSQAVANFVLGQAERKYSAILDVVGRTPNEFAQLGKSFDDITNKIKELAAVFAGPFATALKETPTLAFGAFALLLSGPMKAMGFSFRDIADESEKSSKRQGKDLKKLKKQREEMLNTADKQQKKLTNLAKKEQAAGVKSKVLDSMATGTPMSKKQRASFQRSLKFAQANVDEHGKITAGMFRGRDAKILASFQNTMTNMDNATQQTVSKYQLGMKRMQIATKGFAVVAKGAVAGIAGFAGKILGAFGWIGIIVLAYQTLTAALEKYRGEANDTAEDFDSQQAVYDSTIERLASLNKEYIKLAEVTAVRISIAEDLREIDLAAQAVSESITTSFNPATIDIMTDALSNYSEQTQEVLQNQKLLTSEGTASGVGIAATLLTTAAAGAKAGAVLAGLGGPVAAGVAALIGGVAGLAGGVLLVSKNMDLVTDATKAAGDQLVKFRNKGKRFKIDENLEAVPERIEESLKSLKAFREEVGKTEGISNFAAFEGFEKTLAKYDLAFKEGMARPGGFGEQDVKNMAILGDVLKEDLKVVADLNAHLKALPDQLKASAEAMSALKQSVLPNTTGDQLRLASEAALESAEKIARGRTGGMTQDDKDRINDLKERMNLGEQFAKQENARKITEIRLETASIRNYATLSKAESASLKHNDSMLQSNLALSNLELQRLDVIKLYPKVNGEYLPQVQRQLDELDALTNQERARLKLLNEQLDVLEAQKPFQENIELGQANLKNLGLQKQLLDLQQKASNLSMAASNAREKVLKYELENVLLANPNASEQQILQAKILVEKEVVKNRIDAANLEYTLKIAQINMEERILIARTKLAKQEYLSKAAAEDFDAIPGQEKLYDEIITAAGSAASTARAAADINRGVKTATADGALRGFIAALENEELNNALDQALRKSFKDSLGDAFVQLGMGGSGKEALKNIGTSIWKGVLTEASQRASQAITDYIFGKNDPAADMKKAITDAGDDNKKKIKDAHHNGANKVNREITAALNTNTVKIDCCDGAKPKPSPNPPKPAPKPPVDPNVVANTRGVSATPYPAGEGPLIITEINTDKSIVKHKQEQGLLMRVVTKVVGMIGKLIQAMSAMLFKSNAGSSGGAGGGGMLSSLMSVFSNMGMPGGGGGAGGGGGILSSIMSVFSNMGGAGGGGGGLGGLISTVMSMFGGMGARYGGRFKAPKAMFGGILAGVSSFSNLALPGLGPAMGMGSSMLGSLTGGMGMKQMLPLILLLLAGKKMGVGRKMFRHGGVSSGMFGDGGVAKGTAAGYPAILHGTEAVVPLPNGRSIPVEMSAGAGAQNNNVNVSVNVDSNGQGSVSAEGADNLGLVIGQAVQQEIQKQKRHGGLLSPYGAR